MKPQVVRATSTHTAAAVPAFRNSYTYRAKEIDLTQYNDISKHLDGMRQLQASRKSSGHPDMNKKESHHSQTGTDADDKAKKKRKSRADPSTMEMFALLAQDLTKVSSKDNKENLALREAVVSELERIFEGSMQRRSILRNISVAIEKTLLNFTGNKSNDSIKEDLNNGDGKDDTCTNEEDEQINCTFTSFKRIRGSYDAILKDNHKSRAKLAVTRCPTEKSNSPTNVPSVL